MCFLIQNENKRFSQNSRFLVNTMSQMSGSYIMSQLAPSLFAFTEAQKGLGATHIADYTSHIAYNT
jgi:hypothetical protein